MFGKSKLIRRLLWIGVAMLSLSCGERKGDKDVVVVGVTNLPVNLDGAVSTDIYSYLVVSNVYEGLVSYGYDMKITPVLAESYSVSDDGLSYVFNLRKGVKFHDGTDFNADAVLFSFLRQHDENHPFHAYGPFGGWISNGFKQNVRSIEKVDDYTVKITLYNKDVLFLSKLTQNFAKIINPVFTEKLKDGIAQDASGTGPFIFKSWVKDQTLVLERNPNYWDKTRVPKASKIILREFKDASARLLSLQKGEIDLMDSPQSIDYTKVQGDSKLKLLQFPVSNMNYLYLNNDFAPFNDVRVRKAVAHLVDKEKILKTLFYGMGEPSVNPIPSSLWSYDNDIEEYEYNVEEAKKLLAEAGYPNGIEMGLYFTTGNAVRKGIVEILQEDFRKAGIKVNIQSTEWGTLVQEALQRTYKGGMLMGWVSAYVDPDDYLSNLFSSNAAKKPSNNISGFQNPEFDALLLKAKETSDVNERTKYYKQAQEIFHEQIPSIPLYSLPRVFAAKKNVDGLKINNAGQVFLEGVEKN